MGRAVGKREHGKRVDRDCHEYGIVRATAAAT